MKIHNHITPQEYLKHFATKSNPELVWRFDIRKGIWESLPVRRAGQRKDFISPEDDHLLNENVEGPAQSYLNKLRMGEHVDEDGRFAVSKYVVTMIARTERMRLRMADSLSQDIASVMNAPEATAIQWGVPVAPMRTHLSKIDEHLQVDPLRTKEPILRKVLDFPEVQDHIMKMNWHVLTTRFSERFLTSDNPVFFRKATGLKPPYGEFLFALASKVALVGDWQGAERNLTFLPANSRFVKEFNRYIVSGADRWLYFHKRADWVNRVVQNPSTRAGREAF